MPHIELSTSIHADPDSLWREIGAFDRVGEWHPLVAKVESEGRRRIAYDKEGLCQVEELQELDARHRRYRYTIDSTPMPIGNWVAELSVHDNRDGTSTVRWTADFDAALHDRA